MNATLATGQTVGSGRYILNKHLSDSGLTWLAHDEVENKPVVLKFLPQELLQDPRGMDELRNQVNIARELSHPNVGNVYELYEGEGEEAFVSMEYVEGMNLPALQTMQPGRVFNWTFLAPLLKQIFAGLQFIHQNKIVQGSVKPSSLMLDRKGQLKLLDVGVAGILNNPLYSGPPSSGPGGLLPYLSPKQIEGNLPEIADDIYSLGITIYELLTSTPPYYTGDILPQIRSGTPETPEQRLAKLKISNRVPPIVSSMVIACLAKDPETRPQDVETIAKSLEFAEIGDQEPARPAAAAPKAAVAATAAPRAIEPVAVATPAPQPARTSQPKKRTPVAAIAGVAVAVLLIAGGAFWFLNREQPEETTAPAIPTPKPPVAEQKPETPAVAKQTPKPADTTPAGKTPSPAEEFRAERQAQEAAEIARLAARSKNPGAVGKPVPAPKAARNETSAAPQIKSEAGFVNLFNGEDLTGWAGEPKIWSVEDQAITGKSAPSDYPMTCLVWQGGQVDDFELHFSYRFTAGVRTPQAGAGVEYRAKKLKEFDIRGYQYYLSYSGDNTGFLTGRGREGMISFTQKIITDSLNGIDRLTKVADLDVTPSTIVTLVKKEDWNDVTIIAKGNHLVHMVNNKVVADLTDNNDKKQRPSGMLALYVNTALKPPVVVQFKNIRLKKL